MHSQLNKNNILISIVIVNYNVANEIRNCILSIQEFVKCNYEIIIVDNNSTDRQIEKLISEFPEVKFILLNKNMGFSKGNNIGSKSANGEYLLFLNPDTVLINDCISPIIDYYKGNKQIGAATPMLLNEDRSFQYSAGWERWLFLEFIDSFYILLNVYEKITSKRLFSLVKLKIPFELDWISGAFIIIPKILFDEIGGFYEEYRLNYEDMDLCKTIKLKGYKIIYFPDLKCIHLESRSQKKELYNYIYERYRGKIIYFQRFGNSFNMILLRFIHIYGLLLRMLFSFIIFPKSERKKRNVAFWNSLKLLLGIKSV